jgi:hypothetical protein
MTITDPEEHNEPESVRYFIDSSWFEENRLSFTDIIQARMCDACLERLGEEVEERQPVFDRKTGRMSFEAKSMPYGSNPMKVLRECCSRKKNFIQPDMPTLEAIFRVYLANGNQPMPLSHVREQLQEWCPGGGCQWLLLTDEQMERVLSLDSYYGIRPHQLQTAA